MISPTRSRRKHSQMCRSNWMWMRLWSMPLRWLPCCQEVATVAICTSCITPCPVLYGICHHIFPFVQNSISAPYQHASLSVRWAQIDSDTWTSPACIAGLAAMGLYLYSPEAAFANATSQLCKGLDGVASSPGAAADKLLFISSQTRKFLCKHRPAGTPSSATLAVCEFKLAPSLSSFSVLSCRCLT